MNRHWNRRAFLKATLAGMFVLLGGTRAFPDMPVEEHLPEGRLSLLNLHTDEKLKVTYRLGNGDYDPEALSAIDRLLRCHYSDEVANIDIRTIEFLNSVDNELGGGNEIHIISGYRSPQYNSRLIEAGRKASKTSLHMQGKALDIAFPRIGAETVRDTALKLALGGVGYYPEPGFVHIDSGRVRSW